MIIWLRAQNGEQHRIDEIRFDSQACGVGVECDDEVVRRESFATIVGIDAAAQEVERQRELIVADARARAEALLEQAEAEAARVRDDARREYETAAARGYESGREQGLAEWYERCARSAASQRRVQSLLRERIVELVVDATEQIVRDVDISALFARSAEVVERLVEGSTYLRVRVHPDDERAAVSEFDRLAALWRDRGHGVAVTVVADRAVTRGACLCESDLGTVDASLDTQLAALRAAVTRAVARTAAPTQGEANHVDADAEGEAHAGKLTDAAVQADAQEGEQQDDPVDMPWLGEPGYERIAQPDRHVAGHS
jgi:type III secretion protein L